MKNLIDNSVVYNSQFIVAGIILLMPQRKARSFFPVVFTFIPAIRAWQSLIMALIISNWRIRDPKIRVDRFHPPKHFVHRVRLTLSLVLVARGAIECCHDWRLIRRAERARNSWLFYSDARSVSPVYYFRICDTLFVGHYDSSRGRRYRYHRHVSRARVFVRIIKMKNHTCVSRINRCHARAATNNVIMTKIIFTRATVPGMTDLNARGF